MLLRDLGVEGSRFEALARLQHPGAEAGGGPRQGRRVHAVACEVRLAAVHVAHELLVGVAPAQDRAVGCQLRGPMVGADDGQDRLLGTADALVGQRHLQRRRLA